MFCMLASAVFTAVQRCAAEVVNKCCLPCIQGAPKLKVAIVGSGLAGLSTAVELLDQGYEVDIYEQRPFVGGKVTTCNPLCRWCWSSAFNHGSWVSFSFISHHNARPSFRRAHNLLCVQVASFIDRAGNHIEMGLHVFFGCYFNLFRLMRKTGAVQNLLLKEHTHTFCNTDGDVRELDFRFDVNGVKIGAPFHGAYLSLRTFVSS